MGRFLERYGFEPDRFGQPLDQRGAIDADRLERFTLDLTRVETRSADQDNRGENAEKGQDGDRKFFHCGPDGLTETGSKFVGGLQIATLFGAQFDKLEAVG